MRAKQLLLSLSVIFLFLSATAFSDATAAASAATSDTQILIGQEYFQTTLQAIQQAQKSILVAIYLINVAPAPDDNPASTLLEALISAGKRGIPVKVILDDSQTVNYNAYNRLRQNGIDVSFDAPARLLHAKAVIVDSRISILGSHNWTRAALNDNHEFTTYVDDPQEASKLINYISQIRLSKRPQDPPEKSGVRFAVSAITRLPKPSLFKVFTAQAGQAFDLYLFLIKKAQETGSDTIAINYEEFSEKGLGYFKKERLDIYRVLRKLDSKYGLIEYPAGSKEVRLKKLSSLEYIEIPQGYWDYGFYKKLSLAAKYMYFIALSETKFSAVRPYWFRSYKDMAKKYHISEMSITNGLNLLERENIVEIYHNKPEVRGKFNARKANNYRLNPLSSEGQFFEGLKALSAKYGQEPSNKARELSAQLDDPKDLEKIETYIELINSYGYERVKAANDFVSAYRKETGFRDFAQVILVLKGTANK